MCRRLLTIKCIEFVFIDSVLYHSVKHCYQKSVKKSPLGLYKNNYNLLGLLKNIEFVLTGVFFYWDDGFSFYSTVFYGRETC